MKSHILAVILFLLVNVSCFLTSANIFEENDSDLPGLRGRARTHTNDNHQEVAQTALREQRIIGGSDARANEYNFAVSLQDSIGHFCGGSLIARDVILSAAHCQGGSYDVVLGRHDLDSGGGQKIRMARELPHPKYKRSSVDKDFMLVFLTSAATLNRNVDTVTLNGDSSIPEVSRGATVMGWGDTDIRDDVSKLSDVLREAQVNVISNSECDDSSGSINGVRDDYNSKITENMLCARGNRQDSCQGDSGGPLISDSTQVGVVSWGISCASNIFPGVYARVSRAYDWIESEVCRGSEHAAEAGFRCSGASASTRPSSPSSDYNPGSGQSGSWSYGDSCANLKKTTCKDEPACKWKKGDCKTRDGGKPSNSSRPSSDSKPGSCADLDQRDCKDSSECTWKKGWSTCLENNVDYPHPP